LLHNSISPFSRLGKFSRVLGTNTSSLEASGICGREDMADYCRKIRVSVEKNICVYKLGFLSVALAEPNM